MVKAPLPKAYWILSGLLCLATLVALWLTAWKVREEKLAARAGGRQDPPSETDRLRRLPIPRGRGVHAGHFKLVYPDRDGALRVYTMANQHLVNFTGLREGERRAWQELQVLVRGADEKGYLVEVAFTPGSPCRGLGEYAALKPGLRIELDEDVALVVQHWDPAKPELRFSTSRGADVGLGEGGTWTDAPYRLKLEKNLLKVERD
jgi:hypothetical protein